VGAVWAVGAVVLRVTAVCERAATVDPADPTAPTATAITPAPELLLPRLYGWWSLAEAEWCTNEAVAIGAVGAIGGIGGIGGEE
jgi:hypothetical protein